MFRWAIPKVDIIHILAIHIMGLIKREHGRGGVESRQLFIQSAHAYVTPSLFISFFPFSLFVNSRLLFPIDLTNIILRGYHLGFETCIATGFVLTLAGK